MRKENISDAVIRRLPRYYRQLSELRAKGITRTSSLSLGREMGITASQIRQDFSCFGEFGQQGYGYHVRELCEEIGRILGVDRNHHLIVVGAGRLGQALMENFPFAKCGFTVDAAFDIAPGLIGSAVNGITVRAMDDITAWLRENPVDVVALTVPREAARPVSDRLIALGVRGFWNFTNLELSSEHPGVQFENIHFSDSLLTLSYRIANG
ncbi:MAG: redox-sensing transcriptional repressor Rex [Oscillibacter sp.]|nr:redox-sensing transcriptional repressor Rex [Oscillibacter sp.]